MFNRNPSWRSRSADETNARDRKRRRKTLSCYLCRKRKLKCDREYPSCGRCQKAGHGDSCTYEPGSLEARNDVDEDEPSTLIHRVDNVQIRTPASSVHAPIDDPALMASKKASDDAASSKLLMQAKRISELESRLASLEASVNQRPLPCSRLERGAFPAKLSIKSTLLVPDLSGAGPKDAKEIEMMRFRGKGYKTNFYGVSNTTSLVGQFPELWTFMNDAFKNNPAGVRVGNDLDALKSPLKKKAKEMPINILAPSDAELFSLLPTQEVMDNLLQLYFSTYETTYRILHGPTFWDEYRSFWEDPEKRRSGFMVLLLSIIATVYCGSSKEPFSYIADSSSAREMSILWIRASESWLQYQSEKHMTLTQVQVRCLLLLAKQVNQVKRKQHWAFAGALMRFGMQIGLHRDPSLLGRKIAMFDQELRRRLWVTMTELELQASIDRGMPSSTAGLPFDSAPPRNINDDDLEVLSQQPPNPRPWQEYTETSFLHISQKSLSLRISLNSVINNPTSHLQHDDVLQYTEKIMEQLEKVPPWAKSEGDLEDVSRSSVFPRTLLSLQLQQFLIMLHGPFLRRTGSNPWYEYSRMVCLKAANSIIDQHSKLVESGNYALCMLRNDVTRAALCICQTMFISNAIQSDLFLQNMVHSFSQTVEKVLAMLEDYVIRLGRGFSSYWFVSAAYSLAQSKSSVDSNILRDQAMNRCTRLYYRILASQEDLSRTDALEPNTEMDATGLPLLASGPVEDIAPELEEFEYSHFSGWSFENDWLFDFGHE
ncbi:MAG: hypothetical protein M1834_009715 [Cirrosporium novae-zelandiae]|nr:MAG: hypothetical protein M1834_009715 [Cirrosporium novae-zelandiae]